jgi:lipid II:glycine glycyltransferase (peptidoglycan interpeptide bridge formation enzyme)
MQITLSKDPRIWNQFLEKIQENTFLQTLQWQEFNQKGGFETWRYEMCDQTEELISVCLIIKIVAKRATFLLIPHGPLIDTKNSDQTQEILRSWTKFWKNLAKYEGCSFVRVQPIMDQNNSNQDLFSNLNFRKGSYSCSYRINHSFRYRLSKILRQEFAHEDEKNHQANGQKGS